VHAGDRADVEDVEPSRAVVLRHRDVQRPFDGVVGVVDGVVLADRDRGIVGGERAGRSVPTVCTVQLRPASSDTIRPGTPLPNSGESRPQALFGTYTVPSGPTLT